MKRLSDRTINCIKNGKIQNGKEFFENKYCQIYENHSISKPTILSIHIKLIREPLRSISNRLNKKKRKTTKIGSFHRKSLISRRKSHEKPLVGL